MDTTSEDNKNDDNFFHFFFRYKNIRIINQIRYIYLKTYFLIFCIILLLDVYSTSWWRNWHWLTIVSMRYIIQNIDRIGWIFTSAKEWKKIKKIKLICKEYVINVVYLGFILIFAKFSLDIFVECRPTSSNLLSFDWRMCSWCKSILYKRKDFFFCLFCIRIKI